MYACWPSVTVTNTAAVQTYLLVECYCKMDACWTVATLLTFCHSILHVCWRCASLMLYLLVWCLTLSRACLYGVSLSAMPAGIVCHYQPCLLAWCFIIGHAFWFGTSLSAMPVGVVPHYSHTFWCGESLWSCLLVCCLIIGHACWHGNLL